MKPQVYRDPETFLLTLLAISVVDTHFLRQFQLLLEKKCDLDLADEVNGNSPLMLATSLNQVLIN